MRPALVSLSWRHSAQSAAVCAYQDAGLSKTKRISRLVSTANNNAELSWTPVGLAASKRVNYDVVTSLLQPPTGLNRRYMYSASAFCYRAALNAGRSSQEKAVCLSVWQTRVLWQNGIKICPDFYTLLKIIWPSFPSRKWLMGGDPFYLKFWVNRPPLKRNHRFWTDIRL